MYLKLLLHTFHRAGDSKAVASVLWEDGRLSVESENKELERKICYLLVHPVSSVRTASSDGQRVGFRISEVTSEEFLRGSLLVARELQLYGEIVKEKRAELVALDFDGTLWDTAHECYVLTCEAFGKLGHPVSDSPGLEERFQRGRFFVRNADEFYLLMKWILEHPDRDPTSISLGEQEALRGVQAKRRDFERIFYELRKEWREMKFQEWSSLQRPYPGVLNQVKQLEEGFSRVVVATTKDEESARRLLSEHGVSLDVVGKERSLDKAEQIRYISSSYEKRANQIIFVDDLLDQILRVQSADARVALAAWGYNTALQRDEATKLGITVLQLDQMADSLLKLA